MFIFTLRHLSLKIDEEKGKKRVIELFYISLRKKYCPLPNKRFDKWGQNVVFETIDSYLNILDLVKIGYIHDKARNR